MPASPPAPTAPAPRTRLGHAHLRVNDLDASVRFYLMLPGFRVTESVSGRFAFLSGGDSHHDLALQQAGRPLTASASGGTLYHLAFDLADDPTLDASREAFGRASFPSGLVDRGISRAAYLSDPDGNGVELYTDRRVETGIDAWEGLTRPIPRATL